MRIESRGVMHTRVHEGLVAANSGDYERGVELIEQVLAGAREGVRSAGARILRSSPTGPVGGG